MVTVRQEDRFETGSHGVAYGCKMRNDKPVPWLVNKLSSACEIFHVRSVRSTLSRYRIFVSLFDL